MRAINKVIVHCSDTETGTVATIKDYHVKVRGWLDIGYHHVIYADGSINDGRPIEQVGAHCQGHNEASIGVCLIGEDRFTLKQFLSLKRYLEAMRSTYDLSLRDIYCHYELDQHGKTCPNFKIEDLQTLIDDHGGRLGVF